MGVMYGRVPVGKKSCTAVGRAWPGISGDQDDRVDLIGSGNLPLLIIWHVLCFQLLLNAAITK